MRCFFVCSSGSMEFSADMADPNLFFPVMVNFASTTPFSNILVGPPEIRSF